MSANEPTPLAHRIAERVIDKATHLYWSDFTEHGRKLAASLVQKELDAAPSSKETVERLREALADLYRDEKLDDDDPRLLATRSKVSALLAETAPKGDSHSTPKQEAAK